MYNKQTPLHDLGSIKEAHARISKAAQAAGMAPSEFFKLQTLFYTIDAGAYPALARVFRSTSSGKLLPCSPEYKMLAASFGINE